MIRNNDDLGGTAACMQHELVDGHPVDPRTVADVAQFRRSERERFYGLRKGLSAAARRTQSTVIADALTGLLGTVEGLSIAVYWPIMGEPDLRPWMKTASASGAHIALPVVHKRHAPLEFRPWSPDGAMVNGMFNIPIPAGDEVILPDIVVSPLVAADGEGYRLGNGGGYYDRTLADLPHRPRIIGVGHSFAHIRTIYPQPWDIPMHSNIFGDGNVTHHA